MLRTVYKFVVPVDDAAHSIPGDIVHVGRSPANEPDDRIIVWSEVVLTDDGEPSYADARLYRVYGTGQPLPRHRGSSNLSGATHVGTVQTTALVWHLYDVTAAAE